MRDEYPAGLGVNREEFGRVQDRTSAAVPGGRMARAERRRGIKANPEKTIPKAVGVLADGGRVHETLRSLAARVQRATRGMGSEPHELHALARQIYDYRKLVRNDLGDDVRRWLRNLQHQVEGMIEPSALAESDDPCGSSIQFSHTFA